MLFRILNLTILPIFVFGALYLNWESGPFKFDGPFPLAKAAIWLTFALFSMYSGYCTLRENLFHTLREICHKHFGRQICIDLYLGAGLILFLIYLNEPTFAGFLIWMIPTLLYLNVLTLLYFAIHFDSIVAKFLVLTN